MRRDNAPDSVHKSNAVNPAHTKSNFIDGKDIEQQERALAESAYATIAKFQAVFNQSEIFVGILDLQGYLREINDLAVDWCGYTRAQALNRLFWETPWWRGSE